MGKRYLSNQKAVVVNPNLGELFRGSFCGEAGDKITPCLKLNRIMLKNLKLVCKYTNTYSFN